MTAGWRDDSTPPPGAGLNPAGETRGHDDASGAVVTDAAPVAVMHASLIAAGTRTFAADVTFRRRLSWASLRFAAIGNLRGCWWWWLGWPVSLPVEGQPALPTVSKSLSD
jgi:hypothetical protein